MDFFIYFVDRGYDFRPDYGKLDILASLFPSKSFIALTATAPVAYQNAIIEHFAMQNPLRVLENPNRSNIFCEINQRPPAVKENNEDQFEKLINKLGSELKELRIKFPLTIVYTSLHLCGFGYNLLEQQLGDFQYFPPGCVHIPSNRLFAQFHSPQSKNMKEEIIKDVTSDNPIQRLLLVTIAFGMGIDPPNVQRVIHFGVPRKMEHYLQETGRAGRNGQFATATMYFNSNDIAANVEGMDDSMRNLCRNQDEECRRKLILNYFTFSVEQSGQPLHLCCDICKKRCKCDVCLVSDSLAVISCGDGRKPVDECEQVVPSFSVRQKEEIRKQLEDYKNTLGKASRFGLGPATGFNDKLIEMVCKKAEILLSREAVQQYLPVWREEHVDNIFRIVQGARDSHL